MWSFGKKKKKSKMVRKTKKRYPRPEEEEHNFDKDLTDEEFFEIMDDD